MEIISKLSPGCLYNITGENYEDIVFLEGVPSFTKKEYQDALKNYDAWKTEQNAQAAARKTSAQAKLAALGLTVEDLTALGL